MSSPAFSASAMRGLKNWQNNSRQNIHKNSVDYFPVELEAISVVVVSLPVLKTVFWWEINKPVIDLTTHLPKS